MTLLQRISDPEIEANASAIATAALEHPLNRRLDWRAVWPAIAVRAGAPNVDSVGALQPVLVAIDAAEIAVGPEAR